MKFGNLLLVYSLLQTSASTHAARVSVKIDTSIGFDDPNGASLADVGDLLQLEDSSVDEIEFQFSADGTNNKVFTGTSDEDGWSGFSDTGAANLIDSVRDGKHYYTGAFSDADRSVSCILKPDASGTHIIKCSDTTSYPDEEDPHEGDGSGLDSEVPQTGTTILDQPSMESDTSPIVDVLMTWSKSAECFQSNQATTCSVTSTTKSNMIDFVKLAIKSYNTAAAASGVNARLRYNGGLREPNYSELNYNFEGTLLEMQKAASGTLYRSHNKRLNNGADLVAMITDHQRNGVYSCGIGYVGSNIDTAFTVTDIDCAIGNLSFAHEIGHNLGCTHDRGTKNACSSSAYNFGYRDPSANFRSIMAYNCARFQCDNMPSDGCSRVQMFANNYGFKYNGDAIGNALNDCARTMNEFAPYVSEFYDRPSSPTAAPAPVCKTLFRETYASAPKAFIYLKNGASISKSVGYKSTESLQLKGINKAQSWSKNYGVSSYSTARFVFYWRPSDMAPNDIFRVQYSMDNGPWTTFRSMRRSTRYANKKWYKKSTTLDVNGVKDIRFRIIMGSSGTTSKKVNLDFLILTGCT